MNFLDIPTLKINALFTRYSLISPLFLFVEVEALRPSQQFFSHVGTFSLVYPVLSNEDDVSCSRTQHRAAGEMRQL